MRTGAALTGCFLNIKHSLTSNMVDDSLIEEIRTHSPADNRALTERYNEE